MKTDTYGNSFNERIHQVYYGKPKITPKGYIAIKYGMTEEARRLAYGKPRPTKEEIKENFFRSFKNKIKKMSTKKVDEYRNQIYNRVEKLEDKLNYVDISVEDKEKITEQRKIYKTKYNLLNQEYDSRDDYPFF